MNNMNQKISISEKIGYSLGDCSANLVFQMMMIYQTKFYTDVFGLEGAIAGSVMLIARIVDAFVDPTVGILSEMGQIPPMGTLDRIAVHGVLCAGILQSRHRG